MRVKAAVLGLFAATLVAGTFAMSRGETTPANAKAPHPAQRTGNIIVHFKQSTSLGEVGRALADARSDATASTAGSGLVLLQPTAGQDVDAAVAALHRHGSVAFAEPDVVVTTNQTPTDPYYSQYQWSLPQINLPTAWNTTTGSAAVIVAVVDTGVDSTHPDLAGKLTTGANAGYNFVANTTNTTDDQGHGTFVSSIVAANTNNGAGGAGVCWLCKIMPVKVLDNQGSGSTFGVSQGIDWAVSHGAKVINLSLGASSGTSALQISIDNAWNSGVVVVAASGNNAGDADTSDDGVLYPAAYPNVIAVGSNDSNGSRSYFSNYGPELDVMAPGNNVFGALCNCNGNPGTYGTGGGTSFASPHVAGVAALLIAAGITDKNQIVSRMESTATDMGAAGFDNLDGWGRINAASAINPAASTPTNTPVPPTATATRTNTPVPPTATRTNTPVPPTATATRTNTPVPPTATRTNTPVPPTATNTATNTPVPPTATATRTNTPVPPTATNTATPTATATAIPPTDTSTATATSTATPSPAYSVQWDTNAFPPTAAAGAAFRPAISLTNTGTLTWSATGPNAVRLAYHWRNGACAGTTLAVWDGIHTSFAADVPAGGSVTNLAATVNTPGAPGTYCLSFDLIHEGVTWFSWKGAAMKSTTVTVSTGVYGVVWGANNTPATMTAGAPAAVTLSFTNAGSLAWPASGANAVKLAYHWRNGGCPGTSVAVWDGLHNTLAANVPAGGAVTGYAATVNAPAAAGTYCLSYDFIREGVTWFSWQNAATYQKTVSVIAP